VNLLLEDTKLSSEFVIAGDEHLGPVLCPLDPELLTILRGGNPLNLNVIYAEAYNRSSNWIAIEVQSNDGSYCKLSNLTDHVLQIASDAFECQKSAKSTKRAPFYPIHRAPERVVPVPTPRMYRPPAGWRGPTTKTTEKVEGVLGVLVVHEDDKQTSVFYTTFGLARLPVFYPTGTWALMTILKERLMDEEPPNFAVHRPNHHVVRRFTKISPPMKTRVITIDGEENILLCGKAEVGKHSNVSLILGPIDDNHNLLNSVVPYTTSHTVEMGLVRNADDDGLFWEVLKYHGVYDPASPAILFSESIMPYQDGERCEPAEEVFQHPLSQVTLKARIPVPTSSEVSESGSRSEDGSYSDGSDDGSYSSGSDL